MDTPTASGYGPSLPALLGPRLRALPRAARRALALLLALVVLAGAWALVAAGGAGGEKAYVAREPIEFNLRYPTVLDEVPARGEELVRFEQRRSDGLFVQSFAVQPLTLPGYAGSSGGILPVFAERYADGLRQQFAELEVVQEGKARINDVPGYGVVFRARDGERRLYGRHVMLLPDTAGARRGVVLKLLATPAAAIGQAEAVGAQGTLKTPLRSFRFGTEAP